MDLGYYIHSPGLQARYLEHYTHSPEMQWMYLGHYKHSPGLPARYLGHCIHSPGLLSKVPGTLNTQPRTATNQGTWDIIYTAQGCKQDTWNITHTAQDCNESRYLGHYIQIYRKYTCTQNRTIIISQEQICKTPRDTGDMTKILIWYLLAIITCNCIQYPSLLP
jgi:hypothetical protein